MATCPNINLPEWKELVASKGEDLAYYLWYTYDGKIPANELLENSPETLNKVKQVIDKMGVQIKPLEEYAKDNPAIDESSYRRDGAYCYSNYWTEETRAHYRNDI